MLLHTSHILVFRISPKRNLRYSLSIPPCANPVPKVIIDTVMDINFGLAFVCYWFINLGLCLLSVWFATYWEPAAAGSGIPEVKAYLNGTKIPGFFRLKTLIAKLLSMVW